MPRGFAPLPTWTGRPHLYRMPRCPAPLSTWIGRTGRWVRFRVRG